MGSQDISSDRAAYMVVFIPNRKMKTILLHVFYLRFHIIKRPICLSFACIMVKVGVDSRYCYFYFIVLCYINISRRLNEIS